MRMLIAKPEAVLEFLIRAHEGETPEDLMFEILDQAADTTVNLEVSEDE